MKRKSVLSALALFIASAATIRADEITDWNGYMLHAALVGNTSPLVGTRVGAIVQSAVFDAVNGIERKYQPVHVAPNAPAGASQRAAAVQAAYTTLVALYLPQKPDLDAKLAASLDAIASPAARAHSVSIQRGIAWGQTVAEQILAWRATDGFTPPPPPFVGGTDPGEWRPTPPSLLSGAAPQFAHMTPWVMGSQAQFRPSGPPALDSDDYAADLNETEKMGSISSPFRTADQTVACNFWAASGVLYFWNSVAVRLAQERNLTFSEEARLLGHVNLALGDAGIACWDAKYHYVFWRPITAIHLADTDGNDDTTADLTWTPLLVTPNHPEYPSGHSTTSGAAIQVLRSWFGENTPFWIDSDVLAGVVRVFPNFTSAREEIANARIYAGIHFRSACDDGFEAGTKAGANVVLNSLQRVHGNGN